MDSRFKDRRTGVFDDDKEKWVLDSSLDYKGGVYAQASTGVWKAYLFIIGKPH